jgi:hypothetical protein
MLAIGAAVLLGATSLGCGVISQAKQAIENVSEISEMADLLDKSAELTYTAEYKLADGGTATAVQQPPNAAFLGKTGRYILTKDSILLCSSSTAAGKTKWACQRQPNATAAGATGDQDAYMQAIAGGGGFVSTPMALALLTAASVLPGTKVEKSSKKIADLNTTCLDATELPSDQDANTPDVRELHVCVAENGVLAAISGKRSDGDSFDVTLTKFSTTADPKLFQPPAGAQIVDVTQIQPK